MEKNNLSRLTSLILAIIVSVTTLYSQTGTTLPKFNIFDDANLVLETEKLNDFDYKFKIVPKEHPDQARMFVVMPLTRETFVNSFSKEIGHLASIPALTESLSESAKKAVGAEKSVKEEAVRVFLYVQASGITSASLDATPTAGTLCLRNEIAIRQYLKINSKRLQVEADSFLVVRIPRNGAFAEGKVINKKSVWNESTKKYEWGTHKYPESTDFDSITRSHFSDKRVFALAKKMPGLPQASSDNNGKKPNTSSNKTNEPPTSNDNNQGIFETYLNKAEALNRLDYLAAKNLSEKLEEAIDSIRKEILLWEEEAKKQQEIKNSAERQISDSQSTTSLRDSLNHKREKFDLVRGQIRKEFNKLGGGILYHMTDTFSIIIRDFATQNAIPIALEEYVNKNRFLKNNREKDIDNLKSYIQLLTKMKQNTDNRRKATANLTNSEKEILFGENYYEHYEFDSNDNLKYSREQMREMVIQDYTNKRSADLEEELTQKKANLEKRMAEFDKIKQLEPILEKFIETNDSINAIANQLRQLASKDEISQLISKQDYTIRKVNKTIDSIGTKVLVLRKKIHEIQSQNPLLKFQIEYTNIEFNQGFIENIVVYGSIAGRPEEKIKFTNVMPIGFSRKKDFDDLANYDLWTEPTSNNDRSRYSMNLGDFIENYQQNLGLNRRDYSPEDGTKKIDLQTGTCVELKKAPTYRLLEGKIFSDFVGLDQQSPNGLIQTEIGQKINLRTSRIGKYYWGNGGIRDASNRLMYRSRSYVNRGWLGYIHPLVTLSKIENKNRSLLLDSRDRIVNNEYLQERYSSTMQLRNYEYFSAGCDLNLFTWDRPTIKSTFYLDLGFRFGRTQVIDSIRAVIDSIPQNNGKGSEFGLNTFRWYPKVIWEIKPEERYGLSMSYAFNHYNLLHPTINQVAVPERYKAIGQNRMASWYGTAELQAYFNPSADNPTGKLFFRYTFNHQGVNLATNFHQAQVGYSFFFLGRNKVRDQQD